MKTRMCFILSAMLPLLIASSSFAQPPGFSYLGQYQSHWYYLSNSRLDITTANDACLAVGGSLVCIGSQGENDYIHSQLYPILDPLSSEVLIGFYETAGDWGWVDGEPVTYINWNPGPCGNCPEPSGDGPYCELYVIRGHPWNDSWNGCWNDCNTSNCSPMYAVMEMPCSGNIEQAVWHFSECTGTVAHDASGNGFDLTLQDGAAWTTSGWLGCGADLTDPDGKLNSSHLIGNGWDQLRIEAYVRPTQIGTGPDTHHPIVMRYIYYASNPAFFLEIVQNGMLYGGVYSSNGSNAWALSSAGTFVVNQWYHVVMTWASGQAVRLYVNDALVATGSSVGGTIRTSTHPLTVGWFHDTRYGDFYFQGYMDEVSVSRGEPCLPPLLVHIYDHFCLNFDEPGQVKTVYWCCPWDGPPHFSWLPGCEYQLPGCQEVCPPYVGPVTWTKQYDSSNVQCPLPGGWFSARFTAQGEGCVCMFFEFQEAVELIDFAAIALDGNVALTWATASETDNDRFEIHRSSEGSAWSRIGTVPGHGTSSAAHQYSYLDEAVETGTTYSYRLASVDLNGAMEWVGDIVTATPSTGSAIAGTYALHQNHPNPFNPSTEIVFEIAEAGQVALKVFNVAGQEVATLLNGPQNAGSHRVTFNGSALPSGVYFYSLSASDFTATRKMLLLK